jgi:ribosomal protein L37AE/L43A
MKEFPSRPAVCDVCNKKASARSSKTVAPCRSCGKLIHPECGVAAPNALLVRSSVRHKDCASRRAQQLVVGMAETRRFSVGAQRDFDSRSDEQVASMEKCLAWLDAQSKSETFVEDAELAKENAAMYGEAQPPSLLKRHITCNSGLRH